MSIIDLSTFHNTATSSQMLEEIEMLNHQAWEARLTNRNRCLELSHQALEKADQIHYRLGRGFALRGLGFCAYSSADHTAAFSILSEGMEIGVELEDPQLERDCLNFLAAVSASIGDIGGRLHALVLSSTSFAGDSIIGIRFTTTCLEIVGGLFKRPYLSFLTL